MFFTLFYALGSKGSQAKLKSRPPKTIRMFYENCMILKLPWKIFRNWFAKILWSGS